jgi:hypothetical protein
MATVTKTPAALTPLKYLMGELNLTAKEWMGLDSDTKDWLRQAAAEEMAQPR